MEVIVSKIFFNDVPLIAAADYEIMEAKARIVFHDMPQNGLPTNFDHGLWLEVAFLTDAGPKAAGQNHDFHHSNSTSFRQKGLHPTLQVLFDSLKINLLKWDAFFMVKFYNLSLQRGHQIFLSRMPSLLSFTNLPVKE